MVLPSEWPHPRLEHWRTLLRARAIENQCFFVGVNRVGTDRTNHFCGHSAIIDPSPYSLLLWKPQPPFFETDVLLMPQDNMIQNFDIEKLACLHNTIGQDDIFG